jgi:hypothetical protein
MSVDARSLSLIEQRFVAQDRDEAAASPFWPRLAEVGLSTPAFSSRIPAAISRSAAPSSGGRTSRARPLPGRVSARRSARAATGSSHWGAVAPSVGSGRCPPGRGASAYVRWAVLERLSAVHALSPSRRAERSSERKRVGALDQDRPPVSAHLVAASRCTERRNACPRPAARASGCIVAWRSWNSVG